MCAIVNFSSTAQSCHVTARASFEIDSVIRTGARYTHVLNEMSAVGVIEQGRFL